MSGTTNTLTQTSNLLAGTASLTIDATQYPVVSDAKHSVSITTYKWLAGMDGLHGQALDQYMPGYIEATVRDQGSVNTAMFMAMRNSLVILSLASGKVVTGYGMGCMKAIEVDAKEGTFSVRFEGSNVVEFDDVTETKLIEFDPPLEVKDKAGTSRKIASISLREPVAREVRDSERAYVGATGPVAARVRDTALLALVAGAPDDVIKAMPVATFNEACAFVRAFINAAPEADYSRDRPSELVVTLDEAIEQSGQQWDTMTLHEPTTGDVEMAEQEMNSGMDAETLRRFQIVLVSRVSKAPRFIVERLPIRKLDEAARYIGGFIRAGRTAGEA